MKTMYLACAIAALTLLPSTSFADKADTGDKLKCGKHIGEICGELKGEERRTCALNNKSKLPQKCAEKLTRKKKEKKEATAAS
jgi:hypothetical protein